MGGSYSKSVYNQLMDVMERLDAMESECKKSHKETRSLNAEIKILKKENTRLKEEIPITAESRPKRSQAPRQATAAAAPQKLMWRRRYGKVSWNTVSKRPETRKNHILQDTVLTWI